MKTIKLVNRNQVVKLSHTGRRGLAGTITVGTVTTGAPDQSVTITNVGTSSEAILNFVIPQGIQGDPATNIIQSVQGRTGDVVITKEDLNIQNIDNTSDADKPVSTAQQTELDKKVDKVAGKALSTNDYTTPEKSKLAGIATGATANDSNAQLRDRTTHTGMQPISSVTDLQDTLNSKANTNHTHTAANVTDFDIEVSNNTDVAANTAARHTHANKAVLDATTASFTTADETKLDGIAAGAQVNTVTSVNTRTGAVTGLAEASDLTAHTGNTSNPHSVTKAQVGLGNVDNTSDLAKPISTLQQTALDGKFTQRTITGTTNQITVTNGDGVSGNPTLSLPSAITTPGTLTTTGVLVTPNLNSLSIANLTNTSYTIPNNTAGVYTAYSPVPKYLWHDVLNYQLWWGTPTHETYNGTWNSATLNKALFANKENQVVTVINGTTYTAARWTWNSSNISFSFGLWWVLGFTYVNPASSKDILIESSTDGSVWTTRHTTTANTASAQPVWLYVTDWAGATYIRLTITVTNSQPLAMSSIKALSARWGNQGGGSENNLPYTWDNDGRITVGTGTGGIAGTTNYSNGALNVGLSTATTAAQGIYFGTDTNLYRGGADILKTDDSLTVGANLYPVTDSASTLGTSSLYWSNTYTDRLYLNATAYLDGATAGIINITGSLGPIASTAGSAANNQMYINTGATGNRASINLRGYNASNSGDFFTTEMRTDTTELVMYVYDASVPAYLTFLTFSYLSGVVAFGQNLAVADAKNIALGAATGTKIGTATTQKLGFYNATPVVQPTGNAIAALTSLGLLGGTPTVGASGSYVGNTYTTRINLNATSYIDGATPGSMDVTGLFKVGGNNAVVSPTGAIKVSVSATEPSTPTLNDVWVVI